MIAGTKPLNLSYIYIIYYIADAKLHIRRVGGETPQRMN